MARIVQAGDDFVTEGERLAADELSKLPSTWTIIANKTLPTAQGRSHEIDFIVIGSRVVFVIDEKSWRGRIHGSDAIWVRDDGSSERSPLGKADYVAKVLAGHLRAKTLGFSQIPDHPVASCVLLSRASQRPNLRDPRAAEGVLLLSEAVERLQARDGREGDPQVGVLRKRITTTLVDLTDRPKFPRAIGPYTITEVASGRGGSFVFHANHAESGPRLLTMYNVAAGDLREFYLQEHRALTQLRGTGLVPECLDPFPWSDDFLVAPSHLPAGVSLSAHPRPDGEEAAHRELKRAAEAFRSLARIHAAGVVHRALGPETVYVDERDSDVSVMFSDFFAARRGEQTISPRLDTLAIDDPYAAPEISLAGSYGFASPESDTYSLALILLERLSGVPVAKLVRPDGGAEIPGPDEGWSYLPHDVVAELRDCFSGALAPGIVAPPGSEDDARLSAEACAERLDALFRRLQNDKGVIQGDTLLDGRYQVERVLGVGASARTLLATDTEADGLFALKQFLRPAESGLMKEARREFEILRNYPAPHLPRVYDVYPLTADVHIKLEYVQGVPLTNALPGYAGHLESCRQLAGDLLAAIEHLEQHQLLHRDIKPDNVMIRDGSGEAVLIDFGAATPVAHDADIAGTPGYLPPEAYFTEVPPPSTDRYALGVLLFRALTGRMPFVDETSPFERALIESVDFLSEEARSFARALLRAVTQNPEQRYHSATEFREALLALTEIESDELEDQALPDLINPTVDQLRGLFRNSARGNADNRGLDTAFARETYVPTALDEQLLPAIFERKPRAVFLSGNPGDGKTAFLGQVQQSLRDRGAKHRDMDESGWVWTLDGHTYRACYDASEAHAGMSADEQVRARLQGLEGDEPPHSDLSVLVAINDGRLADLAERFRDEFGWLTHEIDRANERGHEPEPGGAWVVDLKRRAYVGLRPDAENQSVMRRILAALVASERWDICAGCSARQVCPIRRNALALDGKAGGETAARLEYLLLVSHLRGQRHVTIRDLRSGLAYLLTGDLGCEDVHAARHGGEPAPAHEYWRSAFTTESAQDVMLGELTPLDPARYAQPRLERFLFFHQTQGDAPLRSQVYQDGQDFPPTVDAVDWLAQVKRRLFFESRASQRTANGTVPSVDWAALLPYRYVNEFIAVMTGERDLTDLLPRIARGIGRSDGLSGAVLKDGLCLQVDHSDVNRLTVLKQFPLEQFTLTIRQPRSADMIEALPQALILTHNPTNVRLEITLELFELLLRLADGLEPGSPELQPLLEDMAPFKSAVQLNNTKDLVLVEGGRHLHRLTQRDGKVVRLPAEGYGDR